MKPKLVDAAPDGAEWWHEIKFDGYRTQIIIANGQARAYTSSGLDWSEKYAPIVAAAARLSCRSATLDGEMIVQDAQGRSDFAGLRRAIGRDPHRLIFYAFDLLSLDGADLRSRPLRDRRVRLEALIGPGDPRSPLQFSAQFEGNGPAVFAAADRMGLEGIVSKRVDSRYASGESDGWVKIKTFAVGDYEIVGVETKASGIPVVLLTRDGSGVGEAMLNLKGEKRTAFWEVAHHLETPRARLAGHLRRRKIRWLNKGLKARVRHLRGEETLRHATVLEALPTTEAQQVQHRDV